MARGQGEQGHVVSVAGQEGRDVLVPLPMVGFPDGFQLQPGVRVVLVTTPSGPAVRPLVQATHSTAPPDGREERVELSVPHGRAVLQEATVVGEQPSVRGSPTEDVIWVVESDREEEPGQVIAVRRVSRPRR